MFDEVMCVWSYDEESVRDNNMHLDLAIKQRVNNKKLSVSKTIEI